METISGSIFPLVALAFVLGMKHGMDADHLATIDGLTRFNAAAGRKKLQLPQENFSPIPVDIEKKPRAEQAAHTPD